MFCRALVFFLSSLFRAFELPPPPVSIKRDKESIWFMKLGLGSFCEHNYWFIGLSAYLLFKHNLSELILDLEMIILIISLKHEPAQKNENPMKRNQSFNHQTKADSFNQFEGFSDSLLLKIIQLVERNSHRYRKNYEMTFKIILDTSYLLELLILSAAYQ